MKTAEERARQCVEEFEKEEFQLSTAEYNALCDKVELFLKEQDELTRYAAIEAIHNVELLGCVFENGINKPYIYVVAAKNAVMNTVAI